MEIAFKKGVVSYKVDGQGPAIVFLHGFMESARIWRAFSEKLNTKFKVIRINLPGHGKSSVLSENHSMELMAEAVKAVLDAEKITKAMLVGHSMGGYVSLAFAELHAPMISGLVMFNSICFADAKEKKADRERAMKAADAHKMKYITSVIPNLFFERSGVKASKRIFKMVKIASKQPKEGILAAIAGMRDRKDRAEILKSATFPVMILAGHDDLLIPLEKTKEMAALNTKAQLVVLDECAHLAFIEQKKESIKAIQTFALQKIL
jgi:pimeloyl-ACP methyl ester carboxylesterase